MLDEFNLEREAIAQNAAKLGVEMSPTLTEQKSASKNSTKSLQIESFIISLVGDRRVKESISRLSRSAS